MIHADEQLFEIKKPHHKCVHPPWVYEACKINGVSRSLLSLRLKNGDHYHDAVRKPHRKGD